VLGARNAGIEAVYYNPAAKPHSEKLRFEVRTLEEVARLVGV
jgi:FMN phosphatase YigB (HAD superfamily)